MGSSRKHRKTRKHKSKKGGRIADIPNNAPVNFQQDEYSSRFFTDMGTAKRIREEVGPQFMDGGARKTKKRRGKKLKSWWSSWF
jgi:hypothetical protein